MKILALAKQAIEQRTDKLMEADWDTYREVRDLWSGMIEKMQGHTVPKDAHPPGILAKEGEVEKWFAKHPHYGLGNATLAYFEKQISESTKK